MYDRFTEKSQRASDLRALDKKYAKQHEAKAQEHYKLADYFEREGNMHGAVAERRRGNEETAAAQSARFRASTR